MNKKCSFYRYKLQINRQSLLSLKNYPTLSIAKTATFYIILAIKRIKSAKPAQFLTVLALF